MRDLGQSILRFIRHLTGVVNGFLGNVSSSRLRKKGVSVKLPCKLSPEHDDIRPKRVLKSRPL